MVNAVVGITEMMGIEVISAEENQATDRDQQAAGEIKFRDVTGMPREGKIDVKSFSIK